MIKYNVYVQTSSDGKSLLSSLGNTLSFTDTSIIEGETYYYQVSAVNTIGEGEKSHETSVTINTPPLSSSPGEPPPPTEKVPASDPDLLDTNGNPTQAPTVNTVSIIQSEICNKDNASHTFTFIVQVKNARGVMVGITWIQDLKLSSGACIKPGVSWIPDKIGTYTIEVFVWERLGKPIVLSPLITKIVTVG